MAGKDIHIRQAEANDQESIVAFFQKAYGPDRVWYFYPHRWFWLYRDNPFIPPGFGMPAWIALCNDEIVGHTGAMFVPCKLGSATRSGAWSVDTVVLPEYRNLGIGTLLQKANQASHDLFMSLSMSPANRYIKMKIGAVEGPRAELYVHANRVDHLYLFEGARSYVKKRLGHLWGGLVWNLVAASGVPWLLSTYWQIRLQQLREKRTGVRRPPTLTFRRVCRRLGTEVDALWTSMRRRFDFAVERNHEYLNWKYLDQPASEYECFDAYIEDALAGLVVLRRCKKPEPPLGVIAEVLWRSDSESIILEMIQFALDYLNGKKPIAVYCAASVDEHLEALRELGFLSVSSSAMCIFDRLHIVDRLQVPWSCLLSKGDQDWDQYPSARHLSISQIRRMLRSR